VAADKIVRDTLEPQFSFLDNQSLPSQFRIRNKRKVQEVTTGTSVSS